MANAIIIPSIGHRPWRQAAIDTFEAYANHYGTHVIVETAVPVDFAFPALPDFPGRANKIAYACKSYFAWKHLANYERIAVVDDTCCVRPSAPDIFQTVPPGHCGYTHTSPVHAEKSFQAIRRFVREKSFRDVPYDTSLYMNSGVMVYDQGMREAFSPDKIIEAADLLYAKHPHQTLVYYLLRRAEIHGFVIDKAFNTFPAMHLERKQRASLENVIPHISEKKHIYHVSALYKHRQRIIEDISALFLARYAE